MNPDGQRVKALHVYKHLIGMALADGHISKQEEELLTKQRAELGLSLAEQEDMIERLSAGEQPILPEDQDECREILLNVLELAASDGIAESEIAYVAKLAGRMGISKKDLDELIEPFRSFGD